MVSPDDWQENWRVLERLNLPLIAPNSAVLEDALARAGLSLSLSPLKTLGQTLSQRAASPLHLPKNAAVPAVTRRGRGRSLLSASRVRSPVPSMKQVFSSAEERETGGTLAAGRGKASLVPSWPSGARPLSAVAARYGGSGGGIGAPVAAADGSSAGNRQPFSSNRVTNASEVASGLKPVATTVTHIRSGYRVISFGPLPSTAPSNVRNDPPHHPRLQGIKIPELNLPCSLDVHLDSISVETSCPPSNQERPDSPLSSDNSLDERSFQQLEGRSPEYATSVLGQEGFGRDRRVPANAPQVRLIRSRKTMADAGLSAAAVHPREVGLKRNAEPTALPSGTGRLVASQADSAAILQHSVAHRVLATASGLPLETLDVHERASIQMNDDENEASSRRAPDAHACVDLKMNACASGEGATSSPPAKATGRSDPSPVVLPFSILHPSSRPSPTVAPARSSVSFVSTSQLSTMAGGPLGAAAGRVGDPFLVATAPGSGSGRRSKKNIFKAMEFHRRRYLEICQRLRRMNMNTRTQGELEGVYGISEVEDGEGPPPAKEPSGSPPHSAEGVGAAGDDATSSLPHRNSGPARRSLSAGRGAKRKGSVAPGNVAVEGGLATWSRNWGGEALFDVLRQSRAGREAILRGGTSLASSPDDNAKQNVNSRVLPGSATAALQVLMNSVLAATSEKPLSVNADLASPTGGGGASTGASNLNQVAVEVARALVAFDVFTDMMRSEKAAAAAAGQSVNNHVDEYIQELQPLDQAGRRVGRGARANLAPDPPPRFPIESCRSYVDLVSQKNAVGGLATFERALAEFKGRIQVLLHGSDVVESSNADHAEGEDAQSSVSTRVPPYEHTHTVTVIPAAAPNSLYASRHGKDSSQPRSSTQVLLQEDNDEAYIAAAPALLRHSLSQEAGLDPTLPPVPPPASGWSLVGPRTSRGGPGFSRPAAATAPNGGGGRVCGRASQVMTAAEDVPAGDPAAEGTLWRLLESMMIRGAELERTRFSLEEETALMLKASQANGSTATTPSGKPGGESRPSSAAGGEAVPPLGSVPLSSATRLLRDCGLQPRKCLTGKLDRRWAGREGGDGEGDPEEDSDVDGDGSSYKNVERLLNFMHTAGPPQDGPTDLVRSLAEVHAIRSAVATAASDPLLFLKSLYFLTNLAMTLMASNAAFGLAPPSPIRASGTRADSATSLLSLDCSPTPLPPAFSLLPEPQTRAGGSSILRSLDSLGEASSDLWYDEEEDGSTAQFARERLLREALGGGGGRRLGSRPLMAPGSSARPSSAAARHGSACRQPSMSITSQSQVATAYADVAPVSPRDETRNLAGNEQQQLPVLERVPSIQQRMDPSVSFRRSRPQTLAGLDGSPATGNPDVPPGVNAAASPMSLFSCSRSASFVSTTAPPPAAFGRRRGSNMARSEVAAGVAAGPSELGFMLLAGLNVLMGELQWLLVSLRLSGGHASPHLRVVAALLAALEAQEEHARVLRGALDRMGFALEAALDKADLFEIKVQSAVEKAEAAEAAARKVADQEGDLKADLKALRDRVQTLENMLVDYEQVADATDIVHRRREEILAHAERLSVVLADASGQGQFLGLESNNEAASRASSPNCRSRSADWRAESTSPDPGSPESSAGSALLRMMSRKSSPGRGTKEKRKGTAKRGERSESFSPDEFDVVCMQGADAADPSNEYSEDPGRPGVSGGGGEEVFLGGHPPYGAALGAVEALWGAGPMDGGGGNDFGDALAAGRSRSPSFSTASRPPTPSSRRVATGEAENEVDPSVYDGVLDPGVVGKRGPEGKGKYASKRVGIVDPAPAFGDGKGTAKQQRGAGAVGKKPAAAAGGKADKQQRSGSPSSSGLSTRNHDNHPLRGSYQTKHVDNADEFSQRTTGFALAPVDLLGGSNENPIPGFQNPVSDPNDMGPEGTPALTGDAPVPALGQHQRQTDKPADSDGSGLRVAPSLSSSSQYDGVGRDLGTVASAGAGSSSTELPAPTLEHAFPMAIPSFVPGALPRLITKKQQLGPGQSLPKSPLGLSAS